jgi:hypothetical protein
MLFSIFWLLSMAFLANDEIRITDWPVNEWSLGELICQGASSLSDAELLVIFLQYRGQREKRGRPGQGAVAGIRVPASSAGSRLQSV